MKKSFILRINDELMDELNLWAKDELRSVNAQIEYILREAVRKRRGFKDSTQNDSQKENNLE